MPHSRESNKPSTILYAQACMYAALLSALIMTIPDISEAAKQEGLGIAGLVLIEILIFGPLCYLVFEIGRHKNRARIIYAGLTVTALTAGLLNVMQSPKFLPGSPLFMVVAVPNIIALTMLFWGKASAWFKESEDPSEAQTTQSQIAEEPFSTSGITEQTRWSREPLFVLKCRPSARFVLVVVFLAFIGFFAYVSLVSIPKSADSTFQKLFETCLVILVLSAAVYFFCDQLMIREIRVHKDRIVQVWWLLGSYELHLLHARLQVSAGRRGRVIALTDRNVPRFRGFFKTVSYYDQLADPKDVKRLNLLLADLSGCKPEEFERCGVIMDPLIRKEKK